MKRLSFISLLLFLTSTVAHAGKMTDDVGTTFYPQKIFTRIISLYAAHTENLFSLGLNDEIIGVTKNEDYPSHALGKPQYSTGDSVEKFIAAKPDMVLVRPKQYRDHPALWNALKKHGIQVLAYQPTTIGEMYGYWRALGRLTGREPQAEVMVGEFKEGIEFALQRIDHTPLNKRPFVFFESIHDNYSTFSPDSMPIFVLKMAGGRNIATDAKPRRNKDIAPYGMDRMLSKAEKIDIYLAQYSPMNQVAIQTIMNNPAASRIKAVRDRNVFLVDEHLVSRPTMRLLEGIASVYRLMHPDESQ